jgi:nitroimidazol reductase NimA-like FMN-containing flavoprotein (pyridoxamine 5'-phosphate oxidase superfamily)
MAIQNPVTELNRRFSDESAAPTSWAEAQAQLEQAEIFWLSTVRPDGRPHVTPLVAVWLDGALYFCTGAGERKARNLTQNAHCILTTGCNSFAQGLDLVVEGEAVQVRDEARLERLAAQWAAKYNWPFEVRDGAFYGDGGRAEVYEVTPTKAFGFGKGNPFSQTRWRF